MAASINNSNRLSLAMERTGQWVFSQNIPTDASGGRGPEIFEKAAKFCYGVNFEITIHNVAALRCAAEYLQMTDKYCDGNLAGRTEDFLSQVALSSLSGALVVLKSCEDLLPMAEELNIVKRCVDLATAKPIAAELVDGRALDPRRIFFEKLVAAMKSRGAKIPNPSECDRHLRRAIPPRPRARPLGKRHPIPPFRRLRRQSPAARPPRVDRGADAGGEGGVPDQLPLLPPPHGDLPPRRRRMQGRAREARVGNPGARDRRRLGGAVVTYNGERLFDLESVRRIVSGFVEKEKSVAVFNGGDFREAARKVDDDLYRAIDIYLKAHPNLDEIEREKACSVMDPLKLSYEARLHASQNKRLPVQIVLHALYYDQLKLRSGAEETPNVPEAVTTRKQLQADVSLVKENEALRAELMKMKMYVTDLQKNRGGPSKGVSRKPTFFSSVSKTLGKLNPFKNGSKDTSNIEDGGVDITKPRRRRFSIS
ncbi:phototropic-responsive NPH3 family protein [Actinidia rufa]|uniref:Phototropic-responsive NPH3 family protein n=1 Tax=Actinidia rufa TaxID=165716 RepID=A0A7J0FST2_9ERIC|nr:phototropic-responsive NPH3 family protein [Actinidia rufa]